MSRESKYTQEQDDYILSRGHLDSWVEIGQALNITRHQARGRHIQLIKQKEKNKSRQAKEERQMSREPLASPPASAKEGLVDETRGNTRSLETTSFGKVRTVEDAIAKAEVDMNVWELERFRVNSWEMGSVDPEGNTRATPLWQVRVDFKRRKPVDMESYADEMVERMSAHAPEYDFPPVQKPETDNPHLLELCIPDLHLGKLGWGKEVGENYDSSVAKELYLQAVFNLMTRSESFGIEQAVLVIGNDMLHVDNLMNTTTGGTPQDVDGRWSKSFVDCRVMLTEAIDLIAARLPVEVVVVPGNHDRERMYYVGDTIASWYRKTDRVTVRNEPTPRKYVRYGVSLLGFTHGSDEKPASLPLIMAQERAQEWAGTKFREWHIGHLHKRAAVNYTSGDTHQGVVVRTLPALCGTDSWHHQKGYVKGVRAAEAYLWGKQTGYAGHLSWSAPAT